MDFPENLLDVSWSIQYIPCEPYKSTQLQILLTVSNTSQSKQQLEKLGEQCLGYIQSSQKTELVDELNDDRDKTGQLRECTITKIHSDTVQSRRVLGLLIELRHQKTTHQVVLLARRAQTAGKFPVVAVLCKSSQVNLRRVKAWLEKEFFLPQSFALELSSEMLAKVCSQYITQLATLEAGEDDFDALRMATVKQVVGTLKVTITFSAGVAADLKSIDLDLPSETIDVLLKKVKSSEDAGSAFLEEFQAAIRQKTGLRLPVNGRTVRAGNSDDESTNIAEPPMKISKITCAAFAISIDGRIKFASRPILSAEAIGYLKNIVTKGHLQCLRTIVEEAEARAAND